MASGIKIQLKIRILLYLILNLTHGQLVVFTKNHNQKK